MCCTWVSLWALAPSMPGVSAANVALHLSCFLGNRCSHVPLGGLHRCTSLCASDLL